MATTISAMDLVTARYARGWQPQAIDEAAVAQFVDGAQGQPRDKLIVVVQRMHAEIERGRKAGGMSLETMAAAADALTAIIAEQK